MSFSLNTSSGVITQSGTDTDLSGLSLIAGVTVYDDDPNTGKVTYDMGDLRLDIDGTLSHDPDRELMIFHHEKSSGSNSVVEPVLVISAGATYNYGVKTTTSDGKVGYSTGCGLMVTGRGYSNWHPSDNAINFSAYSANFVCRGGVIECSRGLYFGGNADIEETVFLNASDRFSLEIRIFGNSYISTDRAQNIVLAGGISIMDAYRMTEQKIVFREGAISRVYGEYYEAELFDFDVSKNIFNYDIGNCAITSQSIQDHHIVNSATGSDVRSMWRNTIGNGAQMGNTFIHKEVSFNIKDTSATAIEGVKLYLQDNPSNFAKSISVTTTNAGHTYPTPTLSTAVVSNGEKTISYDYTGAIEYEKTTDVNGDIAKFRVLTATQFLEYSTGDSSATQYFNTFSGGRWREADGQEPKYSDWDTTRFGNFYKVDRRSDFNSNADEFNFKFCSYGHMLSSTTQALKGLGELEVNWLLFDDSIITESNRTVVDAYTEVETATKFYDRAKSFLTANYSGEVVTIVSRAGIDIDAGSYNIEIDASALSAFAFDGSKITIKSSAYSGNLTTSGLVTLANGAVVLGTITDANGSRATLQYSISGLIQHSRVQIYNVTTDAEIFNGSVNATTYSSQYTEGTEVTAGDEIRLRVTRQNGVTAYLPFTATAIATASGFSLKASQLNDLVYNTNGIDGSLISTLTADFPNVQVDVDDTDGLCDVREIYARYASIITTEEGIRQWFGGITAINAVNYQVNTSVNNLTIQNVGTNGVNLGVARIFRDDGAIILAQGNAPITQDNGEFVQFIQPQLNSAMNANEKLDGVSKNTKLIPSLL